KQEEIDSHISMGLVKIVDIMAMVFDPQKLDKISKFPDFIFLITSNEKFHVRLTITFNVTKIITKNYYTGSLKNKLYLNYNKIHETDLILKNYPLKNLESFLVRNTLFSLKLLKTNLLEITKEL